MRHTPCEGGREGRRLVIERNLRLVGWYARHRLPGWLRRRAGGCAALAADLCGAYVAAVDAWLASGRRSKLSTYVCKALQWESRRLAAGYLLVRVPPPRPDARVRSKRRRKLLLELSLGAERFGGAEGRREDASLLVRDAPPERRELAGLIGEALLTLTCRQREVVRLRYGLGGGHAHTLKEVGRVFALTAERVRQIEAGAVRKLRNSSRGRSLCDLV